MPPIETWTVGRLLQWTADYLKRHGADTPRLDAEVLLAHALGCRRIDLYTAFEQVPTDSARATFREMVLRRAEGMPVAYLVGHREFYSLDFLVTPDVLIPRPETELVVLTLIERARQWASQEIAICDVGTGSGNIAVAAAKHLPRSLITAIDISAPALDVARANAQRHGVLDRIELIQSDLLAAIAPDKRFHFVVSNPPYVAESERNCVAPDVRSYEPAIALIGGKQGTEVLATLIPQAVEHLYPGGHLIVEVSPMIHQAVVALIEADNRLALGPTVNDLARLPRVVQAQRKP